MLSFFSFTVLVFLVPRACFHSCGNKGLRRWYCPAVWWQYRGEGNPRLGTASRFFVCACPRCLFSSFSQGFLITKKITLTKRLSLSVGFASTMPGRTGVIRTHLNVHYSNATTSNGITLKDADSLLLLSLYILAASRPRIQR